MKIPDQARMAEATRLTQQGRLKEAMALLSSQAPSGNDAGAAEGVIDMTPPSDKNGAWTARGMPEPKTAQDYNLLAGLNTRFPRGAKVKNTATTIADGASFTSHIFSNAAGQRPYKLYIPSTLKAHPALIVMLHGCTQSPDDFATGTRMNELAEANGFLVAYPGQLPSANTQRCWNWFNAGDQHRAQGEPEILAGLTKELIASHGVDTRRVFVAGLSAGGAVAAIMGANYPDLYAGIGVHSGLACGAAKDMPSAFTAMSKGGAAGLKENSTLVPTIVFHGDADATVHASNGEQVLTQARARSKFQRRSEHGTSAGGVRYTRTTETNEAGRTMIEHWVLHGVGHAWSGGSGSGSYTAPHGPDASREMVRFFLKR